MEISRYLPPHFFLETLKKTSFPPPEFFLFPLKTDSHQLAAEDTLPQGGSEWKWCVLIIIIIIIYIIEVFLHFWLAIIPRLILHHNQPVLMEFQRSLDWIIHISHSDVKDCQLSLLNEAEFDMENYAEWGTCYPQRLKAELESQPLRSG